MKAPVSRGAWLVAFLVALVVALLIGGSAPAARPRNGTIGPSSGSSTAWDFAPVGPGVSSGGTIEFLCAPAYCDSYQLTVALPQPDQQFYLTHKATLHIDYTWTSTGPDDMDVFAFAPDGTESGPGSPDDISTGAGHEAIDIANPASGVWTIESHVGVTDEPTVAHAVATLTYDKIPAPPNPTLSGSAPRFSDVSPPTGYQTTDVLQRQNAGEPSLGRDERISRRPLLLLAEHRAGGRLVLRPERHGRAGVQPEHARLRRDVAVRSDLRAPQGEPGRDRVPAAEPLHAPGRRDRAGDGGEQRQRHVVDVLRRARQHREADQHGHRPVERDRVG